MEVQKEPPKPAEPKTPEERIAALEEELKKATALATGAQMIAQAICSSLGLQLDLNTKTGQVRWTILPPNEPGVLNRLYHDMAHIKNLMKKGPSIYTADGSPVFDAKQN